MDLRHFFLRCFRCYHYEVLYGFISMAVIGQGNFYTAVWISRRQVKYCIKGKFSPDEKYISVAPENLKGIGPIGPVVYYLTHESYPYHPES